MPLAALNPTPTLRRAVAALQLLPLIALLAAGATFLLDYPVRGVMPWLQATYGIAHHVYPTIAFLFAAIYAFGLWRFYARRKNRTLTAFALATSGAPFSTHALIVLYYQIQVNPGGAFIGSLQWILIAGFVYVIAWTSTALQELLWEMEFNYAHPIH